MFLPTWRPSRARQTAASDIDLETGRARLSYSRAEDLFNAASGQHTLHKLRHSGLTHVAEAGADVTMVTAVRRHRSRRSLERYVNLSDDAAAWLIDRCNPNRRSQ